jgi:hypothetical protein
VKKSLPSVDSISETGIRVSQALSGRSEFSGALHWNSAPPDAPFTPSNTDTTAQFSVVLAPNAPVLEEIDTILDTQAFQGEYGVLQCTTHVSTTVALRLATEDGAFRVESPGTLEAFGDGRILFESHVSSKPVGTFVQPVGLRLLLEAELKTDGVLSGAIVGDTIAPDPLDPSGATQIGRLFDIATWSANSTSK